MENSNVQKNCQHKHLEAVLQASEDNGFIYRCVDCGLAFEFNLVKVLDLPYALAVTASLSVDERVQFLELISESVVGEMDLGETDGNEE